MIDPITTRENWRLLTKAAFGLTGVTETLDEMIGQTAMNGKEREYLSNLSAAVVTLAQVIERLVIGMDDEGIWEKFSPPPSPAD